MADDEQPSGPSLEPPSLFGRKKKKKRRPAAPEPVATEPVAAVDDSPTTVLDDVDPAPEPTVALGAQPETPPPVFADEDVAPAPEAPPVADPVAAAPVRRRPRREGPVVPGRVAAAIAGLLVGGLVVGLTSASFSLCNNVRGTNSCGGPGLFLLVAILLLAVALGALLLRLFKVPEPASTSFLAVGLTSVIALLFLIDALFEWYMFIVIPLVSVATYLLSYWVTTTFVEPARQVGLTADPEVVEHDVR